MIISDNVSTNVIDRSPCLSGSIPADEVVIAHGLEPASLVPFRDCVDTDVHAGRRGRTVDYDIVRGGSFIHSKGTTPFENLKPYFTHHMP